MLLLIKVCSHKIAETAGLLDQGTDSPHPVQDFVVAPPTNPSPEMFAFCHQISSQIQLKKMHHHKRNHKSLPLSAAAHISAVKL